MRFHCVLTVRTPHSHIRDISCTYITAPGETREHVFRAVYQRLTGKPVGQSGGVVLFWSMEPDHLR